ncbi:DUF1257 domain-containing protein [Luteolibacter yonseiensis]|uniref:DUF1257 domain-containing protein n=1 Tax=Luteolibacter yonseiensis TaxID=1144680 RepID=A0A934VBL5_9BACT|nr:DUF1257 domain-containing protein [Luteolibacter yonseiensis]MBK1817403.1 DUF1257 domain-containing protein [Luteolibacter yonseiensis]
MSHFTTIKTQIRDIPSLVDACVELDLRLVPDSYCRGYAGVSRAAPYVIKLKGPYDIAVDHSAENDGGYGLTADWWDGHVAREVGAGYGRLLQSYGVHRTIRAATQRGLRTTRKVEADGSILLTLEGGSL